MKKFLKILSKTIIFLVILAVVVRIVMVMSGHESDVVVNDSIAVVRLEGVIMDTRKLDRKLRKFDENDRIKGVIIEINSPGGAIAPTQVIYDRIMKMKKPVYSVMETIAASGGYYTAIAADRVYALRSTVTGSIGVIMQYANTKELFEKIGIKSVVFKSGALKDVPSSTRELSESERKYLQSNIDDLYEQFIEDILKRRKISEKELRRLADGRIFSGKQAVEFNLVDRLGTREEAVIDMKDEIGNQRLEVKEFYEKEEGIFREFLSKAKGIVGSQLPDSGFYSIYKPGI
jgi:protease-4